MPIFDFYVNKAVGLAYLRSCKPISLDPRNWDVLWLSSGVWNVEELFFFLCRLILQELESMFTHLFLALLILSTHGDTIYYNK